jgi:antitoxin component of MazEF toxin-antitoxin module
MPLPVRRRQQQVLLRRWNHSLAVRLPARLVKATHYREGMELQLQLRDDGSLLLSPVHGFNRLQFSQEQAQRFERQPLSAPTWPLFRPPATPSSEPGLTRIAAPPGAAPGTPDPGPTYLDTGVVLRLICHEPGSSAQLRWFGIEQRQLVSANLLWIEATAALQIKPPRGARAGSQPCLAGTPTRGRWSGACAPAARRGAGGRSPAGRSPTAAPAPQPGPASGRSPAQRLSPADQRGCRALPGRQPLRPDRACTGGLATATAPPPISGKLTPLAAVP